MLGVLLLDDEAVAWILARGRAHAAIVQGALERARAAVLQSPSRSRVRTIIETSALAWIFYATLWAFLARGGGGVLALPERVLEPFRIANAYGLFATMTPARYEIEFQGSTDGGKTWIAYPFRYKPQDVKERPGIYAPYQPRFDWNLWFASLEPWQDSPWVVSTQARLVGGSDEVLSLFRRDPFAGHPPPMVRTVLWQYWFTEMAGKRASGAWWKREYRGVFTGVVARDSTGRVVFTAAGGE